MDKSISSLNGCNTYTNPLNTPDGNILHCLNLDSDTDGSRIKRPGYAAFLGTPDTSQVNSLFSWTKDDGTTLFLYRASGSALYYSTQGTGAWTLCGNGTIGSAAYVYGTTLNNNFVIGDGVGTMRYSTNGTSFTDIAAAPVGGQYPTEYQGRIYAAGTNSYIFYSTVGTASDWTTDSSSLLIGGPGKMGAIFKASDRLMTTKNSGLLHRWDGEELVDLATRLGPTSSQSIGEVEDFRFWLNRKGIFASNASKPELISNPIQRQVFNTDSTGIVDSVFDTAIGGVHDYDYMLAVGTVKDNFTDIQISNAIINYDYKHNEFVNKQFYHNPTAFHSYTDANRKLRLIFGDANGQVYQFDNSYTSDAGYPIETSLMLLLHGDMPHIRKDFGYIEFFTSPGCQLQVQFAIEDIVNIGSNRVSGPRIWKELGSLVKGYTLFRFPPETRGRLLYLKLYEASTSRPWQIYSIHYTFDPVNL